jgi:hypothetical protein
MLLFIASSCTIAIKDTKACTVSGVLSAGVNCVNAVSGTKTQMSFEELVEMLEPTSERAGAVIIPFDDYIEIKKTIESACVYVRCKKKSTKIIKNIESLFYAN